MDADFEMAVEVKSEEEFKTMHHKKLKNRRKRNMVNFLDKQRGGQYRGGRDMHAGRHPVG